MSSQLIADFHKYYLTPSGAIQKINTTFNSKLKYKLTNAYHKNEKIVYSTIRCIHGEIPYSFYIVNGYNNVLALNTGNITIPQGNYNANTFMAYLLTVLPVSYSMTFNTLTGKYTLSRLNSFTILSTTTCWKLLGIAKNTSYASVGNSVTMPFMANFLGTKNLYIKIEELILDNLNPTTQDRSTILNIPCIAPPYGIIFYDNKTTSSSIIKNIVIPEELTLEICDDDNNLVDFQNTEFSLTLEITNYHYLDNLTNPNNNKLIMDNP